MPKKVIFALSAIALVAGLLVWRTSSRAPGGAALSSGQPAGTAAMPDVALQDYSGRTVRLREFIGQPLVINSWAAWCPFCKKELPDFATVQREIGDRAIFIAIDRAEPLATAKRYSDELGIGNNMVLLLDESDSFYRAIGGFSMPETIFVDARGAIREHKRGPMTLEEIRVKTRQLLNE